ncbi:hypothetical protein SO802_004577 [Lithocarpus litseifolius]|uniref:Uncharacterized protein n=1 Tax=Lithocarpus litseifolius TaxID=425828 RepID=A0AAW2E3E5_9ROSI
MARAVREFKERGASHLRASKRAKERDNRYIKIESEKNKERCSKQDDVHTTGSCSFAVHTAKKDVPSAQQSPALQKSSAASYQPSSL